MSEKQPEALRLADELDESLPGDLMTTPILEDVSAELRRLHAVNKELLEALNGGKDLINVVRMPNAEYVADAHNAAVEAIRAAIAKAKGGAA